MTISNFENGYARDLMEFVRSHEKFADKYDANFDLDFYESDQKFHVVEHLSMWNVIVVTSSDLKMDAARMLLGKCDDEYSIVAVDTGNGFREIEFNVSWSHK